MDNQGFSVLICLRITQRAFYCHIVVGSQAGSREGITVFPDWQSDLVKIGQLVGNRVQSQFLFPWFLSSSYSYIYIFYIKFYWELCVFNSSLSKFICIKLFSYFITGISRHPPHDCVTKACKKSQADQRDHSHVSPPPLRVSWMSVLE